MWWNRPFSLLFGIFFSPLYLLIAGRLIFLLAKKENTNSKNNSLKLKKWVFYFYTLAFLLFTALFLYILVNALNDGCGFAMLAPLFLSPTLIISGLCFFLLFFIYKKSKEISYIDYGVVILYSLFLYSYVLVLCRLFGFLAW